MEYMSKTRRTTDLLKETKEGKNKRETYVCVCRWIREEKREIIFFFFCFVFLLTPRLILRRHNQGDDQTVQTQDFRKDQD